MGSPGRAIELQRARENYAALDAGVPARKLGTLGQHRSGAGTHWLNGLPKQPMRSAAPSDVPLFWVKWLRNWGDALSPAIVAHVSGLPVRWVPIEAAQPFHTCIGSFLRSGLSDAATVWGTGVITAAAKPNPRANYAMVRGPITAAAVRKAGGECPDVFGDPGLLVPRLFPAELRAEHEWGVVLHHRELPHAERLIQTDAVKLIRIDTTDLASVVEQLTGCERILSSSLHGLIAAHAYGISAAWIQPTEIPLGDGTKFADYLLSMGLSPTPVRGEVVDAAMLSRAES